MGLHLEPENRPERQETSSRTYQNVGNQRASGTFTEEDGREPKSLKFSCSVAVLDGDGVLRFPGAGKRK